MIDSWKITLINIKNSDKLMDMFKDYAVKFVLDTILNVVTTKTGDAMNTPCSMARTNYWIANLNDYMHVLNNLHGLNLDYVSMGLLGMVHGRNLSRAPSL